MNSTALMSQAASRLNDPDWLQWLDGLQDSYGGSNSTAMMTMMQGYNQPRLQHMINNNDMNMVFGTANYNNSFSNQLFQDGNYNSNTGVMAATNSTRDFTEAAAAEQMTSGSCSNEDVNTMSCTVEGEPQSSNWSMSKRRKLNESQAKLLERSFEADQRLDAQRKEALASEVGLDERQVAVWFQNRRARSKSKQLQRDFFNLRDNYDALMTQCQQLRQEIGQLTEQLELAHQNQPSTTSSTPSPNIMISTHISPLPVHCCKPHDSSSCSSSSSLLQNKLLSL